MHSCILDMNLLPEENTADGRLTDSLKTEIILAFKDFPSLWNTSLAIYKDKQKKTEDTQVLASRFRMPVDELKKLLQSSHFHDKGNQTNARKQGFCFSLEIFQRHGILEGWNS